MRVTLIIISCFELHKFNVNIFKLLNKKSTTTINAEPWPPFKSSQSRNDRSIIWENYFPYKTTQNGIIFKTRRKEKQNKFDLNFGKKKGKWNEKCVFVVQKRIWTCVTIKQKMVWTLMAFRKKSQFELITEWARIFAIAREFSMKFHGWCWRRCPNTQPNSFCMIERNKLPNVGRFDKMCVLSYVLQLSHTKTT